MNKSDYDYDLDDYEAIQEYWCDAEYPEDESGE